MNPRGRPLLFGRGHGINPLATKEEMRYNALWEEAMSDDTRAAFSERREAHTVDAIVKAIKPCLMKENRDVVDAVERCIKTVQDVDRRMNHLEMRLEAPICPTCGKRR